MPGTRRDRAQAEEAGIKKAKPPIETPSAGIRLWAVFQRGSAHEPLPKNLGSEREVSGVLDQRWVDSPFAQNDGSLTLQRYTREHAHKGGSGA